MGMTFRVARVLPMTGIGADPSLTPEYKGLTDADTIADWRPPAGVTIDKKRVTKADEQYWADHKGRRRSSSVLTSAKKLWGTAFGDVTSLRVPADKANAFEQAPQARIDPAAVGLVFRAVQGPAARGRRRRHGVRRPVHRFLLLPPDRRGHAGGDALPPEHRAAGTPTGPALRLRFRTERPRTPA